MNGPSQTGLTLATRVTVSRILGIPVFIVLLVYYLNGLSQGHDEWKLRLAALLNLKPGGRAADGPPLLSHAISGRHIHEHASAFDLDRVGAQVAPAGLVANIVLVPVASFAPGFLLVRRRRGWSPAETLAVLVAASIVFVAAENFWSRDIDSRWRNTFLFGFIHGFASRLYKVPERKNIPTNPQSIGS